MLVKLDVSNIIKDTILEKKIGNFVDNDVCWLAHQELYQKIQPSTTILFFKDQLRPPMLGVFNLG